MSVRLNNGNGSFGTSVQEVAGFAIRDVKLADVDADGDLDLLVLNGENTGLFTNGSVNIRFNDGSGRFSGDQEVMVGLYAQALTTGDIDGDGDLDLLVSSLSPSDVSILRNNGAGVFRGGQSVELSGYMGGVTVGDIDADGDLDLLVSRGSNDYKTISIYLNPGNGIFNAPSQELSVGPSSRGIALKDVDADGDLDIATSSGI